MKTVFTKDGVEVEKGTNKYKGHIFYDEDGGKYKCLGYFPKLDDCVYENLQTGKEVVGCMDGFYFKDPTEKYAKGSTIKNKYEHNDFPIMFVQIPFGYGKKQGMLVTKLYNLLKKHNIAIDNSKEWHTKGFGEEYENDENHNIVKFNVKDAPNPKKLTEILWNLPNGEYYVSATKDYKYADGGNAEHSFDEKAYHLEERAKKQLGVGIGLSDINKALKRYENENSQNAVYQSNKLRQLKSEMEALILHYEDESKYAKGSTIKGKSAFTFEGLDKRFQKLDWRDTTEAYYGLDLTPFMSVVEEYIEQSGKSSQGLDSHFEQLGWRDTTEAYYGLDFTPFMSEIENYATSKYAKGGSVNGFNYTIGGL